MNPEGRTVTFGSLSTNGGFRLIHAGGGLELMPLPSSPSFTASLRWRDLPWKLALPGKIEAMDKDGGVLRSVPVKITNGEVLITAEPDTFSFRIR
jgi:hypothetical protein